MLTFNFKNIECGADIIMSYSSVAMYVLDFSSHHLLKSYLSDQLVLL